MRLLNFFCCSTFSDHWEIITILEVLYRGIDIQQLSDWPAPSWYIVTWEPTNGERAFAQGARWAHAGQEGFLLLWRFNIDPRGWLGSHAEPSKAHLHRGRDANLFELGLPITVGRWTCVGPRSWPFDFVSSVPHGHEEKPQETNWFQTKHLLSNIAVLKGRHDLLVIVCVCVCVLLIQETTE